MPDTHGNPRYVKTGNLSLCYHWNRTAGICWGEGSQLAGWPMMHKITCDDCGATVRWTPGSTDAPAMQPTPVEPVDATDSVEPS